MSEMKTWEESQCPLLQHQPAGQIVWPKENVFNFFLLYLIAHS